jgi:beta-lactamase regulating signal transducer with metallopeptidase domain/biopolymer transport protein ExbD
MISYLIYSAISLALLLLFYHTVLVKEKMFHFNRWYLLFSLVFSLSIPLIPVGMTGSLLPASSEEPSAVQTVQVPADVQSEEENQIREHGPDVKESAADFSVAGILVRLLIAGYIIGVIVLFVRLLRVVHTIQIKARRNPRTLFEGFEVVLLSEPVVPHTFFSTIFVNKKAYESGKISREILIHERTHARQKHTLDVIFVEALKILFWFNPLLYLFKRAILLNHEFLADEAVLSEGIHASRYQRTLLQTLLNQPSTALASNLNYGLTKRRFHMMTTSINKTRSALKAITIVPLFLTLSILLGCESAPSDADSAVKHLTIELTNSEMVKLNEETIHIEELEEKLEELSRHHELQFLVKEHPDMKTGPAFTVNSLVHQYRSSGKDERISVVEIEIHSSGEIIVDGVGTSPDQMANKIKERSEDISLMISLRISNKADFEIVRAVQEQIRSIGVFRTNYSTFEDGETTEKGTPQTEIKPRNLLTALVDENAQLIVNEQRAGIPEFRALVKHFITNKGVDPELSESPEQAIVAIQTERRTPYDFYTEVIEALMSAYSDVRDEASLETFGVPFSSLDENSEQWLQIRMAYPKKISIAEPRNE